MAKTGVLSDSQQKARNLAKQVAKQMAQEPTEILRQAGAQLGGVESHPRQENIASPQSANLGPSEAEKGRIEAQSKRQLQALESELKDIQAQKKQLEEAKKQAEDEQNKARIEEEKAKGLPRISAKPSRRFLGFGRKSQAEKQQTRVEKPLPPSG